MNRLNCLINFSFLLLILWGVNGQRLGYREVQLTHNNADNGYASYNKNGDRIVFESNRDGHWQIYSMNITGDNLKQLTSSTSNDRRPTWHPYKPIVLFESDRSGSKELFKLDLETDSVSKIPIRLEGNKTFPQFAPNGVEVMFNVEEAKGDIDIYITSHKGRRPKKIVDDAYANRYPRYSPRGDNIVYHSNKNIERDTDVIYRYNIITKERSRLSYFRNHSYFPIWSRDGRQIAYVAEIKDNKPEIYTMRNDGIDKKRITFNNTEDSFPNWSTNNSNLLVTRLVDGHYQIFKIFLKEPLEALDD